MIGIQSVRFLHLFKFGLVVEEGFLFEDGRQSRDSLPFFLRFHYFILSLPPQTGAMEVLRIRGVGVALVVTLTN